MEDIKERIEKFRNSPGRIIKDKERAIRRKAEKWDSQLNVSRNIDYMTCPLEEIFFDEEVLGQLKKEKEEYEQAKNRK
jgi:hypothetical protein